MLRRILPALLLLLAAALAAAAPAAAQQPAPDTVVTRIPAERGEVVIVGQREKEILYDEWHFAPVRVADGVAYLSGVVAGGPGTAPVDSAAFEASVLRAFRTLERNLAPLGADLGDVVMLNTFHVFGHARFPAGKQAHIAAFRRAKDRVMRAPYPAWTAIGVSELFPDGGLVEIQVIAHVGPRAARP